MKKVGLILGGISLVLLFLLWTLFKGTDVVRALTEANTLLGWAGWGLAWLCAVGGAALLARAMLLPKGAAQTDD